MNLFNRYNQMMLRRAGELWTTTLDNEKVEFYGVFDAENRLEDDNTGNPVIIAGSVLTVLTSVAKDFVFNQELVDSNDTVWYCRETLKVDDGAMTRCHLTEKPE